LDWEYESKKSIEKKKGWKEKEVAPCESKREGSASKILLSKKNKARKKTGPAKPDNLSHDGDRPARAGTLQKKGLRTLRSPSG